MFYNRVILFIMKDAMARSYFWTMLCLILHQIDAAYWCEWKMFYLPGGVQGFLAFNLAAIAVVLAGYRQVLLALPRARLYAGIHFRHAVKDGRRQGRSVGLAVAEALPPVR